MANCSYRPETNFIQPQPQFQPQSQPQPQTDTQLGRSTFSTICDHQKIKRIDEDFVKCVDCGMSLVDPLIEDKVMKMQDYVKENRSFDRHFNRNFDNNFPSEAEWDSRVGKQNTLNPNPLTSKGIFGSNNQSSGLSRYRSSDGTTEVIVDYSLLGKPARHHVRVNGKWTYASPEEVKKYLMQINAIEF